MRFYKCGSCSGHYGATDCVIALPDSYDPPSSCLYDEKDINTYQWESISMQEFVEQCPPTDKFTA